jgi:arylsulfatase A-like enzyme
MKHLLMKYLLTISLSLWFFKANSQEKMNIVFILADDLGWSDVTLYGNTNYYETPNLERLAARGITFNRAYAASPLCSPTRASILTGQTPARNGITAPTAHMKEVQLKASLPEKSPPGNKALIAISASRLDNTLPTLGKMIKADGYATAHFGKWHLGKEPHSPLEHGFDVDIPHWPGPGPAGSFVAPWKFPNFKEKYANEHLEDRMTDEAIAWLRNRDASKPFFMNYWQFSVHAPFDAKKSLVDYYRTKTDLTNPQHSPTYAAMVHSLDQSVGRLLDEIDRLGIRDNTAIVFYSDNGGNMYNTITDSLPSGEKFISPPTNNAPLKGGKASMYEGGVRVPCIIVWPGITTPGANSDALIQSTDLYPTILNQLNIALPKKHKIDGKDITPALKGEPFERKGIVTFFPHQPKVPHWLPPCVSVHSGDWKLIRIFNEGAKNKHKYELYNLKWDISEDYNISSIYPSRVKELDALIEQHLKETNAVVPIPNPAFNATKYHPELHGIQFKNQLKEKKININ